MRKWLLPALGLFACTEESNPDEGIHDDGGQQSVETGGSENAGGNVSASNGGQAAQAGGSAGTGNGANAGRANAGGQNAAGAGGARSAGGSSGSSSGAASSGGEESSSGGGSATAFDCPELDGTTPDLNGTPQPVNGVPPNDGYNSFNLEGPVWFDGALYLSEIKNASNPPPARILKYTPGAGVEVFIADAGTNGLAIDDQGRLYGASHKVGGIVRFDIASPSSPPESVVTSYAGKRFSSPNDLTLFENGIIYFTDPFYQAGGERQDAERAYQVDAGGTAQPIDGAPGGPNGISMSPDKTTLYVAGSGVLMAYPVSTNGSLGAGAPFGKKEYRSVDGMGVDCAGNLYLTQPQDGKLVVLSPSGDEIDTLAVASGITNVAFGGPDHKTLYITKLNPPALYQIAVSIPGLPY